MSVEQASFPFQDDDSGDLSMASRSPTPMSTESDETPSEEEITQTKSNLSKVFDLVTTELLKIGAVPLERFETEDNPQEEAVVVERPPAAKSLEKEDNKQAPGTVARGRQHFQAVAKIYEACMRTFESSEAIQFDYKQDLGPQTWECILTITRPDGRKRSYTSGPFYGKKTDAKAQAASVAVGMKVIDFIKFGDTSSKARSNAIVDSLDAPSRLKIEDGKGISFADLTETSVDDANVKSISDCCVAWRAGRIKPVYIHFSEPIILQRPHGKKGKTPALPTDQELLALKQGCALKVEISQHTSRVYSVHHLYKSRAEAKAAVAEVAIKQGVIDFIKYANGQTSPTVFIRELEGDADENLNMEVINETNASAKEVTIEATAVNVTLKKHQIPLNAVTLHGFTNSLPKPFPETPGLRPLADGNPVGWLNAAAQSARGSKMSVTWTYLSKAEQSLHGCLVRFNLPRIDDGKSYLVEPQFIKRSDAKAAVALLAISQNVGGWIHDITTSIENLITPDMRAKAGSLMAPLNQECTRAGLTGQPIYTYGHEEGAVGCALRVEFSPELKREYTVPIQYRTKPDARFAVILQAYTEGVLEFIRFKDDHPPPGYNPELPFDWKMARKIEEAKAHGHGSQPSKETGYNRVVNRTGGRGVRGVWGRGRVTGNGADQPGFNRNRTWSDPPGRTGQHGFGKVPNETPSGSLGSPERRRTTDDRDSHPQSRPHAQQPSDSLEGSAPYPQPASSFSPEGYSYAGHEGFNQRGSEYPPFRAFNPPSAPRAHSTAHSQPYYPPGPEQPFAPSQFDPIPPPLSYYPPHDDSYTGGPNYPPPIPLGMPPPHAGRWRHAYEQYHLSYSAPTSGYESAEHDISYDDTAYDYNQQYYESSYSDHDQYHSQPRHDQHHSQPPPQSRARSRSFRDLRGDFPSSGLSSWTRPDNRYPTGEGGGPSHGYNRPHLAGGKGQYRNPRHDSFQRGPGPDAKEGRAYSGTWRDDNTVNAFGGSENISKPIPTGPRAGLAKFSASNINTASGTFPAISTGKQSSKIPTAPRAAMQRIVEAVSTSSPTTGVNQKRNRSVSPLGGLGSPGIHVGALNDYCSQVGIPRPEFKYSLASEGQYKIWAIVDRERMELPKTFADIQTGNEEVARQVLNRLKSQVKRRKIESGGRA